MKSSDPMAVIAGIGGCNASGSSARKSAAGFQRIKSSKLARDSIRNLKGSMGAGVACEGGFKPNARFAEVLQTRIKEECRMHKSESLWDPSGGTTLEVCVSCALVLRFDHGCHGEPVGVGTNSLAASLGPFNSSKARRNCASGHVHDTQENTRPGIDDRMLGTGDSS